jgi:hypothetical protein
VITGQAGVLLMPKSPRVRSRVETSNGFTVLWCRLNARSAMTFSTKAVSSGTSPTSEAVLTGESFPIQKKSGTVDPSAELNETEFDRGIRRFGYLLTRAMLIMVLLVFVGHMFRGRPPVETLLFSVALAVGLSPSPVFWLRIVVIDSRQHTTIGRLQKR